MNLIERLSTDSRPLGYEALGYRHNPFPPRGQVQDEVYVERPELAPVMDSLAGFLKGTHGGRTWAVAGDSGVGKSNFLRHLNRELEAAKQAGLVHRAACRYLTSQQMTPRRLAEAVAVAMGVEAFVGLFKALGTSKYVPSAEISGTPLGDFLSSVAASPASVDDAARFAIRWLGGQQTYSSERQGYGISMRERTPPAEGLSWLRHVLDLMTKHDVLSRLVLLLDEFEDVQALGTAVQNDYLMTLKGLINAFNLESLFLVLAGQPTAFERMGQRFPSLKTRWEVVDLVPVRRPEEAVKLARQYMEHEHRAWCAAHGAGKSSEDLRPTGLEVTAVFAELLAGQPPRSVTQRDLLARLHAWIESHLQGKMASAPP